MDFCSQFTLHNNSSGTRTLVNKVYNSSISVPEVLIRSQILEKSIKNKNGLDKKKTRKKSVQNVWYDVT